MTRSAKKGLLIAAPSSGSGKTVVTLGLLRAFRDNGLDICGAKAGPDYIDPGFHGVASGKSSVNLDPWAMDDQRLLDLGCRQPGSHLLIEGMMGLFDGAVDGSGSAASLAKTLGLPVMLVVDAAKQSHSIAALVRGFRDHDRQLDLGGVLLNHVGSPRHEEMLRKAIEPLGVPVLGAVPRDPAFELPERHLGLVLAEENKDIEAFVAGVAKALSDCCDLQKIAEGFATLKPGGRGSESAKPLGQRIAVARDLAFSFTYPHLLDDWKEAGSELMFFSPVADEAVPKGADAIFLPGGYPELHAAKLAAAAVFKDSLKHAAEKGCLIYGECGGYMVLGDAITDAGGSRHAMTGLLKLETNFAKRKLHLGYRKIAADGFALGDRLLGHEFHYSTIDRQDGVHLFTARDALGDELGPQGLRADNVMGSYMHIIDVAA